MSRSLIVFSLLVHASSLFADIELAAVQPEQVPVRVDRPDDKTIHIEVAPPDRNGVSLNLFEQFSIRGYQVEIESQPTVKTIVFVVRHAEAVFLENVRFQSKAGAPNIVFVLESYGEFQHIEFLGFGDVHITTQRLKWHTLWKSSLIDPEAPERLILNHIKHDGKSVRATAATVCHPDSVISEATQTFPIAQCPDPFSAYWSSDRESVRSKLRIPYETFAEELIKVKNQPKLIHKPKLTWAAGAKALRVDLAKPIKGVSTNWFSNFSIERPVWLNNAFNATKIILFADGSKKTVLKDLKQFSSVQNDKAHSAELVFINPNGFELENVSFATDTRLLSHRYQVFTNGTLPDFSKDHTAAGTVRFKGEGFASTASAQISAAHVDMLAPVWVGKDLDVSSSSLKQAPEAMLTAGNKLSMKNDAQDVRAPIMAKFVVLDVTGVLDINGPISGVEEVLLAGETINVGNFIRSPYIKVSANDLRFSGEQDKAGFTAVSFDNTGDFARCGSVKGIFIDTKRAFDLDSRIVAAGLVELHAPHVGVPRKQEPHLCSAKIVASSFANYANFTIPGEFSAENENDSKMDWFLTHEGTISIGAKALIRAKHLHVRDQPGVKRNPAVHRHFNLDVDYGERGQHHKHWDWIDSELIIDELDAANTPTAQIQVAGDLQLDVEHAEFEFGSLLALGNVTFSHPGYKQTHHRRDLVIIFQLLPGTQYHSQEFERITYSIGAGVCAAASFFGFGFLFGGLGCSYAIQHIQKEFSGYWESEIVKFLQNNNIRYIKLSIADGSNRPSPSYCRDFGYHDNRSDSVHKIFCGWFPNGSRISPLKVKGVVTGKPTDIWERVWSQDASGQFVPGQPVKKDQYHAEDIRPEEQVIFLDDISRGLDETLGHPYKEARALAVAGAVQKLKSLPSSVSSVSVPMVYDSAWDEIKALVALSSGDFLAQDALLETIEAYVDYRAIESALINIVGHLPEDIPQFVRNSIREGINRNWQFGAYPTAEQIRALPAKTFVIWCVERVTEGKADGYTVLVMDAHTTAAVKSGQQVVWDVGGAKLEIEGTMSLHSPVKTGAAGIELIKGPKSEIFLGGVQGSSPTSFFKCTAGDGSNCNISGQPYGYEMQSTKGHSDVWSSDVTTSKEKRTGVRPINVDIAEFIIDSKGSSTLTGVEGKIGKMSVKMGTPGKKADLNFKRAKETHESSFENTSRRLMTGRNAFEANQRRLTAFEDNISNQGLNIGHLEAEIYGKLSNEQAILTKTNKLYVSDGIENLCLQRRQSATQSAAGIFLGTGATANLGEASVSFGGGHYYHAQEQGSVDDVCGYISATEQGDWKADKPVIIRGWLNNTSVEAPLIYLQAAYTTYYNFVENSESFFGLKAGIKNNFGPIAQWALDVPKRFEPAQEGDEPREPSPEDYINIAFESVNNVGALANALANPGMAGVWASFGISYDRDSKSVTIARCPGLEMNGQKIIAKDLYIDCAHITGTGGSIIADRIHVTGGKSSAAQSHAKASFNLDIPIPKASIGAGPSVSASGGYQQADSANYTPVRINVSEEFTFEVQETADLKCFQAKAKKLNAKFGNLLLESIEDRASSGGANADVSVSVVPSKKSTTATLGGAGAGFNVGKRGWISNISMLVGTESIRVVVNGITTLIGSVIAQGKVDGQWRITEDHGDLQFETKQLVAKDIHNVEAGLTLGGGFSGNAANPNRATYSVKFGAVLKDQNVHASVGQGHVVVHENPETLESINRDVGALVKKGFNFEVRPITVYVPTSLLHPEETAKHVAGRIQDMAAWLESQLPKLDEASKPTPEELKSIQAEVEEENKPIQEEVEQQQKEAKAEGDAEKKESAEAAKELLQSIKQRQMNQRAAKKAREKTDNKEAQQELSDYEEVQKQIEEISQQRLWKLLNQDAASVREHIKEELKSLCDIGEQIAAAGTGELPPEIYQRYQDMMAAAQKANEQGQTSKAAEMAEFAYDAASVLLAILAPSATLLVNGVDASKDATEAATGKNIITGEELTGWRRFFRTVTSLGTAAVGGAGKQVGSKGAKWGTRTLNVIKGIGDRLGWVGKQTNKTGTVWDFIKATQKNFDGTTIPRSFEMTVGKQKIWVAGNGSKHLAEFAHHLADIVETKPVGSLGLRQDLINYRIQNELSSLHDAIKAATQEGITFDKVIVESGWELKFGKPREVGQLPVLFHARRIVN